MRRSRLTVVLTAGALIGAATIGGAATGAGAQTEPSNVRIVHALDLTGAGVGGTPVSVCLNDGLVDADFRVGEAIGPVALDPGSYDVAVLASGAPDCNGAPLFGATLDVPSGQDLTAMAFYDNEASAPGIAVLADDVSCLDAGFGRVTARHAANVGDVDVLADGSAIFADLPNGGQASGDVPTATYAVGIAPPGSTTPIIGPVDLQVEAAFDTQVYAYGGVATQGAPGVFVLTVPLEVCPVVVPTTPTTPTTVAPTSTAAPVATVQPAFTG